jgi:two-component system LytT family response regulator
MKPQSLPEKAFRFALPTNCGKKLFAIQQIIRLESDSNYTYVYFTDSKPILVAKVLREFEVLLKPLGFIRTHRSHLVNKHHITGMDAEGSISLSDESKAAISRRKRKIVINEINPPFLAA